MRSPPGPPSRSPSRRSGRRRPSRRRARPTAPPAKAAGTPTIELIYPSIVQVRIGRTERALERATKRYEDGDAALAAPTLKVVRRQLAAAWRGAKYVIRTTPPPPPTEDRAVPRRRAKASGDPVGPTYATPAETAFAVLSLQHDVAAATVQLVDGAHGAGLTALGTTLFLALDRREAAIEDIHILAPPPPPIEDRVRGRVSQDEEAPVGFETVMPNTIGQFDDELQAIEGTKSDATDLTAGGRRVLSAAGPQILRTKATVNTYWPPIPPRTDPPVLPHASGRRSRLALRVVQPWWNIVANAAIRIGTITNVICRTNSGSRAEVARDAAHVRGLAQADAGEHPEVAERQLERERQAGGAAVRRAAPWATASPTTA